MSFTRSNFRVSALPLLAPVAFAVLTACGQDDSRRVDEQLRADLAAATQAPRNQYASPQELGYGQGYAPNYQPGYGAYQPYPPPYGYPQQYPPQAYGYPGYPQPATQQRVVYVPQSTTTRRSSAGSSGGGGTYGTTQTQTAEKRNTQKGAIIGAATGAAIGVATSRDKLKGGAIGALGGAVLGGVIGHQIKTPR